MSVNYTALMISFSIFKGLAVILTFFRLSFRLKIQRFWWEDMWAAVAVTCTIISIICVLVFTGTNNYESIFIAKRINGFMFTCIIWSVRMSVIFSIIRIVSSTLYHRITLAMATWFFLSWVATLGLQEWWCANNTQALPENAPLNCVLPRFIIIFEMTINCAADTMTVIFPFKLLWECKLPRRQRRMFISLFTASRFLCAFSLAHLIAQMIATKDVQDVLADLQLSVFLIVCNLVVVVTYIYRIFLNPSNVTLSYGTGDPSDCDDDFTTPAPRSTQSLTTVDLESHCASVSEMSSGLKSNSFLSSTAPSTVSEPER
ncbi:hypothetical protein HD554DRAFT_1138068 [Boletus coccyginus]|nr:hypothetical protein HD554DRAFT_1138068 [Boletus coccyginus]